MNFLQEACESTQDYEMLPGRWLWRSCSAAAAPGWPARTDPPHRDTVMDRSISPTINLNNNRFNYKHSTYLLKNSINCCYNSLNKLKKK